MVKFNFSAGNPLELPLYYNRATPAERREARNMYVQLQGGMCWHCESEIYEDPPNEVTKFYVNEEQFPEGFFDHRIHLHHDHGTGLTVGAVHAYCNAVLWAYHGE